MYLHTVGHAGRLEPGFHACNCAYQPEPPTCTHVQCYPVPAAGYLRRLALGIDTAMRMSSLHLAPGGTVGGGGDIGVGGGGGADAGGAPGGAGVHRRQQAAVHNVQLVRGRPFYGYHEGERLYVKISM